MIYVKVAVIGLGYVGLPLSALLSRSFEVIGFDTDSAKIRRILDGVIPIEEPGMDALLAPALKSGMLQITTDSAKLREAQVKILTVGTPYDEKSDFVDYSQLESALEIMIPQLKHRDVVILKSTVPPGTTTGVVRARIESYGLKVPEDVGLVFAPERMIEGQAIRDFQVLPKIIGASDSRSQTIAEQILTALGGKIIRVSNPETAETIKMVDNYSRYVFLGLTNELALACEKIGVDVLEVIRSAKDEYPRNSGLLLPGPGVGGSCLNKDPFILRGVIRKSGMELEMVKSAQSVNSRMPVHVVNLVRGFRKSGIVTLLGVAFKGDTDDTRYTPAYIIRDELSRDKFEVRLADPFVSGKDIYKNLYVATTGSDILVLLADHSEYREIEIRRLKDLMRPEPVIIDTRGIIDRDEAVHNGFEYHGLGRL